MDEFFERLWARTDRIPGSFTRLSGEKMFEVAMRADGPMVEVGVDQGRSASILMAVAQVTGNPVILVDSWESVLVENKPKVELLVQEFPNADVQILHDSSAVAA